MSFSAQWTFPLTGQGMPLSDAASGLPSFVLHEAGYLARLETWNFEDVSSPFWRLYYNFGSGHYVQYRQRRFSLGLEGVLLLPEATTFSCRSPGVASHLWIHFSVPGWMPLQQREPLWAHLAPGMRPIIWRLRSLLRSNGDCADVSHLVFAFLHLAFAAAKLHPHVNVSPALQLPMRQMHGNPQTRWSNPELAGLAHMSAEGFIRRFRSETGMTPRRYLSLLRIRLAAQQLIFTQKSLEEIADACGFPNRHYLTRVFTRQMGCSPGRFRRRYHGRSYSVLHAGGGDPLDKKALGEKE